MGPTTRAQTSLARFRERILVVLLLTLFITVMIGSSLLALRNVRLGRGDRKGAFRLAAFMAAVFFLRWLFASHHVPTVGEAFNFISGVRTILSWTFFFWVVYLAFEPFVRRRWPDRIVSWSRLLAGGFRDPLVGRDILIGAVFGLRHCSLQLLSRECGSEFIRLSAGDSVDGFPRHTVTRHSFVSIRHHTTNLRRSFAVVHVAVFSVIAVHHFSA